ncbi:MAG: UbiA family prenyltransferase [Candidatus Scalindua sp.]|jgi:4-hydroxybenzoate polyprenyltransferase|nr:UbiA family prenyltransferase [Candidatus Scalindua sp.]MBT6051981.1 UbiA family prenyltransferase [Candidatus Scalindua sp.]MBT6563835.1 UbiA family prenyltransferase [Candidatus Scalindua sp.]MBT7212281.1 UbiA family prenyltransferase [Candidatus Scalindua sp.]MBT7590371.1 UbiA family prenyltransferase [Candidatus Scalindua sp.]
MDNTKDKESTITAEQNKLSRFYTIFKLIKFSHTIFSFPFAVMSAFVAAGGMPEIRQLLLIIGALVMARSCAMSFNRLIDTKYDISNPRTAYRIQLQKHIGKTNLWFFTISCTILFIVCAGMLNRLSLIISPFALLVIFGYSYTKRFTNFSHLVLGLSLSLSPIGAWIGVTGEIALAPFILAFAVLLWTAGFDIIYACQDLQHDIKAKLHSIPKMMGIKSSLLLSSVLHVLVVIILILFMYFTRLNYVYFGGVVFVGIMLVYEHSLVKPDDLSKINLAFFTVNGIISMILMVVTLVDIFIFY